MKRVGLLLVSLTLLMMVPMASAQGADTTVAVSETDELGSFLTDAEGMTLYMFTKDESGISNCSGDCLANWPAFTTEEDAELTLPEDVPGTLDIIEREDDGTYQVTYNGWPLYYWVGDTAAGDTTGQGVGDVWFVVEPSDGSATPEASPAAADSTVLVSEDNADLGPFLTDAKGMTLYLFTKDTDGTSTCVDKCLENWPAFTVEDEDAELSLPEGVPGTLAVIEREDDGTYQVTYNGMPLYYYHDDVAAGDVTGQAKGEVWYVVAPAE